MSGATAAADPVTIRAVTDIGHFDAAGRLLRAYGREWDLELGAQDLDTEARALMEVYQAPDGALLLATVEDTAVGVVAWQRLGDSRDTCQMKRLYVDPAARGTGAGRALVAAIVAAARDAGFKRMVLDTTDSMVAARALYKQAGFRIVEPDWDSPCRAPVFMAKRLR